MDIFLAVLGAVLVTVGAIYFFKAWRSQVPHSDAVGFDASLAVSLIAVSAGILPLSLGLIGVIRSL